MKVFDFGSCLVYAPGSLRCGKPAVALLLVHSVGLGRAWVPACRQHDTTPAPGSRPSAPFIDLT